MDQGKHAADEVWTAAQPRAARKRTRVDADADVVSVLQSWLEGSGATASAAGRYYRRGAGAEQQRAS